MCLNKSLCSSKVNLYVVLIQPSMLYVEVKATLLLDCNGPSHVA